MNRLDRDIIDKFLKINSTLLQVEHIKNRYDFNFKTTFPFDNVMCLVIDLYTISECDINTLPDKEEQLLRDFNNQDVKVFVKYKDVETELSLGATNFDEAIYIASVFIDSNIDVFYKFSLK